MSRIILIFVATLAVASCIDATLMEAIRGKWKGGKFARGGHGGHGGYASRGSGASAAASAASGGSGSGSAAASAAAAAGSGAQREQYGGYGRHGSGRYGQQAQHGYGRHNSYRAAGHQQQQHGGYGGVQYPPSVPSYYQQPSYTGYGQPAVQHLGGGGGAASSSSAAAGGSAASSSGASAAGGAASATGAAAAGNGLRGGSSAASAAAAAAPAAAYEQSAYQAYGRPSYQAPQYAKSSYPINIGSEISNAMAAASGSAATHEAGHHMPAAYGTHEASREETPYHYASQPYSNHYHAKSGVYNPSAIGENSYYKKSSEKETFHEDGDEESDHYHKAKSHGKASEENLRVRNGRDDVDVEMGPQTFRMKKRNNFNNIDYNKSKSETGTEILDKGHHRSSYNKNTIKEKENIDAAATKYTNGMLEKTDLKSSSYVDDEDAEVYDSAGLNHQGYAGYQQAGYGGYQGQGGAASASAAAGGVSSSSSSAAASGAGRH